MSSSMTTKTTLRGISSPITAGVALDTASYDQEIKSRQRFPNAITDWAGTFLTLRERAMIAFMDGITDKPDWNKKIYDEEILAKWRVEREILEKKTPQNKILTEKMFDVCIDELRDYAKSLELGGFTPAISATATVYKSDTIIPTDLKEALRSAVKPLENVPEAQRDWHPGSDNKVLDLVHPSLFPLLYGRSTVVLAGNVGLRNADEYIGQGQIHPVPDAKDLQVSCEFAPEGAQHFYSQKFQWLPCEVKFVGDSDVRISSYINNLHPRHHEGLYKALEPIIARIVPMWDATLSSLSAGDDYAFQRRIQADGPDWNLNGKRTPGPDEKDLDEWDIWELDREWEVENRTLNYPDPQEYNTWKESIRNKLAEVRDKGTDLRKDFATEGLQIIVKLANIHLTPEKPRYPGGSWHIEGQLNEHICASAIYYYDNDNIGESSLAFRETTPAEDLGEMSYEQGDFEHFSEYYGIMNEEISIHPLGQVLTREDRVITFPNVLQHCVAPFELQDKTKPGHRKILALFLVDPYIRIPSTAHVPPQQKHWWRDIVYRVDRINRLPAEITEQIMNSVDGLPYDMEEAKRLRIELMDERKLFASQVNEVLTADTFSFCEH